ncbi:hypothetical protein BUUB107078_30715 [Burkholderia ubonensis]
MPAMSSNVMPVACCTYTRAWLLPIPLKSCSPPRRRSIMFQMNTKPISGSTHDASAASQLVSGVP